VSLDDAVLACADMVKRSGGRSFEIGYNGPDDAPQWWAVAEYRGHRKMTDGHAGPIEAADALAREVLRGGQCQHCGGLVAVDGDDAAFAFFRGRLDDGRRWDAADAIEAGECRYRREGAKWVRSCAE
jgi:hypothetical protein